jgi:ABC-2 type transport system ATP-binding protein
VDLACHFERVTKRFGGRYAVRDLDLRVPRASVYGLLGPNGAGKTTSIRMLMTILRPDSGSIRVFGEPLTPALKDRIGYLPEERGLYRSMRVLDNLVFFGSIHGLPAADAKRRAGEWLERLTMTRYAGHRLQELSKGNQQKIQFIATVLHSPDLLVLDEPFSGLDPVNQEQMRGIILDLSARGTTLILSTHLMDEVERLCTHLTLVHEGKALLQGALGEVRRRFGGDVVRIDFRGDPTFVRNVPGVADMTRIGNTLELHLGDGADPSQVLAQIAPRLAVHRFEVQAASVHGIFVQLVQGAEAKEPMRMAVAS